VPPLVAEIVPAMASLHADHRESATFAERILDRVTSFVGRPFFLLVISLMSAAWIGGNVLAGWLRGPILDAPPFAGMDLILTLFALYIAILILTSQRRADRLANLREQMTRELVLLTEQKTVFLGNRGASRGRNGGFT
jgi:uncharacterized membrane protein